MTVRRSTHHKMRSAHRYLGFFLSGIMAVYAISGITLIFRDSDTFKKEIQMDITIAQNLTEKTLGAAIKNKKLKVTKVENDILYFKEGTYNSVTGEASYTKKELPIILKKMTNFHKAQSGDPLFFLNIFFGLGLLFFVISSFWMFLPSSSVFRKGMLFVTGGIILALVLLFV